MKQEILSFINQLELYKNIGLSGMLDILILVFLIYAVLVWFKKTRAASVLTGIAIIATFYLIARQFDLVMTTLIFEKFFAVFLVALVVIFQEELKSFFEKVALWSTRKRDFSRRTTTQAEYRREVSILTRTVAYLAKNKTGAIIVVKGKDMLARHLEGGVELSGELSEPLLHSIFDPSSPGHDGAVIIEDQKVSHFASHLPLSRNTRAVGLGGTRHSAALGLSELCDAFCIVVSEERGTISVAQKGKLKQVSSEILVNELNRFINVVHPQKRVSPLDGFIRSNFKEKIIAVILALGLWYVNVHSSKVIHQTFTVPVTHVEMEKPWIVENVDPKNVDVTFHGKRSDFYFLTKDEVKLLINIREATGTQHIRLYSENLTYPKNLIFDKLEPSYIKVRLQKEAAKKDADPKPPAINIDPSNQHNSDQDKST